MARVQTEQIVLCLLLPPADVRLKVCLRSNKVRAVVSLCHLSKTPKPIHMPLPPPVTISTVTTTDIPLLLESPAR